MNILDMKPHPLAERLPKQAKHERLALKESMEKDGFDARFKIIIWLDPKIGEDRILDGIHRRDVAKELGLDRIPFERFEGDYEAASRFVFLHQFGRRNSNPSERAFIVAEFRKDLGFDLEQAANYAHVSVSLMEKASSIAHKSKKFSAKGLRGEMSVSKAASMLKRTTPESSAAGEDPWKEIEKTKDRMTAAEDTLIKWAADYLDPLLDRRGAEMLKASLSHRKVVGGRIMMGLSLVDAIVQQIRRNKPKGKCPVCTGAGCADCGDRRYTTAHEQAQVRNQGKK